MSIDRPPPPGTTIKSYATGVAARTQAQQEARKRSPTMPDLGHAAVTMTSSTMSKDPRTLQQVTEEQRRTLDEGAPSAPRLSDATIEGMRAIKEAQEKKQAEARAKAPPVPVDDPAEPVPAEELADNPEDVQLVDALRRARENVIQNERERAAVAARCTPIDFAEGLLTGEFVQLVPIIPDKLTVRFKCLTAEENNEIRLLLYDEIKKDERKNPIFDELMPLYQTAATILSINGSEYERHMKPIDGFGGVRFDPEAFKKKVAIFMNFPLPLISSLLTHSGWFEQRVRDLFVTTDAVKNG